MNAGVILFLIFAVCVLIGVPISMSLGIGSLAAVALGNLGVSPAVIAQRVFGGLQSTSIMAIAFFILAGNLMAGGGISRRIVNFANCLIGNIRGGMSVALVIACAFFAALSGSAPATVVAIGSMLYADMVKQGYPEDRTAGLLVIAGGLGPVIPPSIIMVLYCTLTGASVTNMFSQGSYDPRHHPGRHLLRPADRYRVRCCGLRVGFHRRCVHLQGDQDRRPDPHPDEVC